MQSIMHVVASISFTFILWACGGSSGVQRERAAGASSDSHAVLETSVRVIVDTEDAPRGLDLTNVPNTRVTDYTLALACDGVGASSHTRAVAEAGGIRVPVDGACRLYPSVLMIDSLAYRPVTPIDAASFNGFQAGGVHSYAPEGNVPAEYADTRVIVFLTSPLPDAPRPTNGLAVQMQLVFRRQVNATGAQATVITPVPAAQVAMTQVAGPDVRVDPAALLQYSTDVLTTLRFRLRIFVNQPTPARGPLTAIDGVPLAQITGSIYSSQYQSPTFGQVFALDGPDVVRGEGFFELPLEVDSSSLLTPPFPQLPYIELGRTEVIITASGATGFGSLGQTRIMIPMMTIRGR